jgi:class 3 adenylate cyclase
VLFCDLVGSTQIAAQLDPEEWREIVAEYHSSATEAIERHGGHVAQYLGDGVMAYFGYPEAHDNDAERGARAGLAILDAVSKLNEHPARPKLSARIGIDSGAVVVGSGAGKDAGIFGDTPNIAARVQAVAEPNSVVITDAAHRLVSGLFVVEDRGAQSLKGIERPVQLFRVIQPSGVRGRLQAVAVSHGLTPFVGREDELRLLTNRWERALDGEGQVALIIGEAGIGKSRLVQRFHEQVGGTPHIWVESAAAPFFQNTPFYSVADMLRQALAWRGDESSEEQLALLEPWLEKAGLKPAETLQLIAPLLNLAVPTDYLPSPLSPEQQRHRLLAALVELVLGTARVQPTVIEIEDLHWADPSTLELIGLLVEQGARGPLLLLFTARPEFRAQWPPRAHHTQINLNRLSSRNVRILVRQVAAHQALSEETTAAVIERTGGVPLFIEELTRAVLESGHVKLTEHEIPVTLRDSLMSRLDRLGAAKEIAQVGAVLGHEFSYELIHALMPMQETELQTGLQKLNDAELLYARGIAPNATYTFKHWLIQDAAYQALLKTHRRELHRRTAEFLERLFPKVAELQPELLARHYTEAGQAQPAVAAWQKAAERAVARGALVEAEGHFKDAVATLGTTPETPAREQRELTLQLALGRVLVPTRGYSYPETAAAFDRARVLGERLGDSARVVAALRGLGSLALLRSDMRTARALYDRVMEAAERDGSRPMLCWGHNVLGVTCFFLGEFAQALEHMTRAVTFYDEDFHRRSPQDPAIEALCYAAAASWHLGLTGSARSRIGEALALAQRLAKPYGEGISRYFAGILHLFFRDPARALEYSGQAIAVNKEYRLPVYLHVSSIVNGWALAQLGRCDEGIALMRSGLRGHSSAGNRLALGQFMGLLAEALALSGDHDAALATIEEADRAAPEERWHQPFLQCLRGEIYLARSCDDSASHPAARDSESAERSFRDAISLANSMGVRSYELRAATGLARLLQAKGHGTEACELLAPLYASFTEGFDSRDLIEAKALIDQLTSQHRTIAST